MIPFLCPTKNRAAQCRLLLESIDRNAYGIFQPWILWKADPEYAAGYEKLKNEQFVKDMGAVFAEESDFVSQFYEFLGNAGSHFALFMDDCIFYRPTNQTIDSIKKKMWPGVFCVSFRLGENTIIHDYMIQEKQQELKPFAKEDEFIWWKFREHPALKNYGFHFSWDGVVYKTEEILQLCDGVDFTKTSNQHAIIPQRIENHLMNSRDKVPGDLMCAPIQSNVVCMNWNCTHQYAKTGQKFGGGMREFQELYMLDHVIDLDSIDFSNITSCHDELSFMYRKI